MRDFIEATLNAGLQIALNLNSGKAELFAKHSRGAGGDISIGADLLSEGILVESLSAFGNIDSEEAGFIDNKKEHTIIIDPLDGSDNFLSQIPYYGASVAMRDENGVSVIGIIMNFCNLSAVVHFSGQNFYGNLAHEFESFSKIAPKNPAKCGIFEGAYRNPHICKILNENNIKFRAIGALALSLGLSEKVNFVLFDGKKRHYDYEAGFLIAKNLHKIEKQNLVLISKDKQIFDTIAKIFF
ncbi:inositol monophosphatase family protein [Helicobacter sp. 23-1044]